VSSIAVLEYDNAISLYLSVDHSRHLSPVNLASGYAFQVQLDEARAEWRRRHPKESKKI